MIRRNTFLEGVGKRRINILLRQGAFPALGCKAIGKFGSGSIEPLRQILVRFRTGPLSTGFAGWNICCGECCGVPLPNRKVVQGPSSGFGGIRSGSDQRRR